MTRGDRREEPVGGTYTLVIDLPKPITLDVGALGPVDLPVGAYAYTGSALGSGGFSRVDRHRRIDAGEHAVRHWHIDYLLGHPDTRIVDVTKSRGVDIECAVAGRLPAGPVEGFGASDCGCRSHLASGATLTAVTEQVRRTHRLAAGRSSTHD
ncbi:GIY-YIG nuclease family protein [Halorubrum vacuolatum]|uniref:Endonuclease-3 n=1 Tax=Halorubrum vacuolatum TaxID=63740 RepID=A0A238WK75_HALVU|nr:GIY-YIG nuclease family protein [Halorubrum vacuolatum]SNR46965.1 endonuclease-3 [Halorubrum vacuolatum]